MNMNLTVRYMIELAMTVPAAVIAIMPVYYSRKVKKPFLFGLLAIMLTAVIVGGGILCAMTGITSNAFVFPAMIAFFIAYNFCFSLSVPKKLFCFANATLLCGFSTTYATFLTAPMELDNPDHVYTVSSGLICLGIAVVFGAIFARTLLVKFPDLFETDSLESAWKVLDIAPIVTTASVVWMNPVSPENVMTGRLRMICLVVLPSIPAVAWSLYHIFWWLAKKMTETTKLQHGYDLLQMEEKQYRRTRRYLQETSEIRHDFRQHIVYISELLEQGQIEKAKKYLSPIMETVNRTHRIICTNQAVDAIANHYDDIARSRNVVVSWSFDLTDKLPIDEADMCAVMGNLVENAIQAAEQLEGDNRLVNVRIGLLPPQTLVISIYNAYKGRLILDKNGLPVTEKKNHGIGLRSVRNIVERYGGTMEIETHNGIFNVSTLMYAPD